MEIDPNPQTGPDLRHSVTTQENRAVAATTSAPPAYGAIDAYGLPAGRSGLGLSGVDFVAGLCVCLMILGPLAVGALHAG